MCMQERPASFRNSPLGSNSGASSCRQIALQAQGRRACLLPLQAPLRVHIPPRAGRPGGAAAAAALEAPPPQEGQAPFLSQPPPFWRPQTVHEPTAWEVGSAPPLPADALRAGALQRVFTGGWQSGRPGWRTVHVRAVAAAVPLERAAQLPQVERASDAQHQGCSTQPCPLSCMPQTPLSLCGAPAAASAERRQQLCKKILTTFPGLCFTAAGGSMWIQD